MTARPGSRWAEDMLQPCGTPAAARRHHRRHEPLCAACKAADRLDRMQPGGLVTRAGFDPDPRPVRNGIPETAYRWRARRYPMAELALARAEAIHGRPRNEAT